jgi:PKD repeat protein
MFTASPTNGAAPLTVTFTNLSTGLLTNQFWNFGDSSTTNTTTNIVSHVYTAGTYTVILTASGPAGSGVRTQSNYIVATGGSPPSAAFSGSPTNGTAPLAVTFTDTSTGSITNRFWDFGDGSTTNTITNSLSHVYNAGTNTVTLIVSGSGGSDTNTKPNYIVATNPPPPVASFTASPTNGVAPLLVSFTDSSTGSITGNFWDFGDGATTNFTAPTNVTHTYGNANTYTVTLIASGPGGVSTNSKPGYVTVLTAFQNWQMQYFGCTNCPQAADTADPDGDGQNNLAEFMAGTNPTNSLSALRIVSVVLQSNDVVITWATAGGRTNAVQATAGDADGSYTTNFIDLSGLIILPGSGDTTTNYVDVDGATNVPSRYYRIRLVP